MADEANVNGVSDPEVEDPHPADQRGVDSEVNDLTLKLKLLELEKFNLLRENDETKERVGELMAEIEKLRSGEGEVRAKLEKMEREVDLAEDGKRAMESIVKRAADLEIEVSRLQHDLNDADDASKEVAKLRSAAEEKDRIIEGLEREVEGFKIGRAESDTKVRELERKIGALEVRAEMELRDKVEETEREISGLKEKIGVCKARIATDSIEDKGSKLQWPVVAAGSTGAIVVAAAVAYVCYSRRQS